MNIPKELEEVAPNSDLQFMFFLTMTSNNQNMDIFFNNPKWYENPLDDWQKQLLEDLKTIRPDVKKAMENATEDSILDPSIGRRVYGNICFWLGDVDQGKRMLDELRSMANGVYKEYLVKTDKLFAANTWVDLNDIYLGTQGISYKDSDWYVKHMENADASLKPYFESRIKFGSWISYLELKTYKPASKEGTEVSATSSCGSSCGGAGAARDSNATNDGAALQSADGTSLGACGCSTNATASTSDSASTQTSSGSCCQ